MKRESFLAQLTHARDDGLLRVILYEHTILGSVAVWSVRCGHAPRSLRCKSGARELWRVAEATLAPMRLAVAERAERYGARTAKRARDNVVLVVGGSAALEAGHRRPQSIARARDADTAAMPR